jgi:hypothetical protein
MDNYGSSHFDVDTFGGDEFGGEEQSETQYVGKNYSLSYNLRLTNNMNFSLQNSLARFVTARSFLSIAQKVCSLNRTTRM